MSHKMSIRRKARSLMLRRDTKTVYVPVADNIYFDGLSYRIRVTRNGVRTSYNWANKAGAIWCRNELLAGRDIE
jgi:hypothetical protein